MLITYYREFFALVNFLRKWHLEGVLNFHRFLFLLFQGLSINKYSRVYFSLCLFLAISGRSQTQRKLNPCQKFPIYGIVCYKPPPLVWPMVHCQATSPACTDFCQRTDVVDRLKTAPTVESPPSTEPKQILLCHSEPVTVHKCL